MTNVDETAALVADLNDLLKLDRDAVEAYTIAIEGLENDGYREFLRLFRTDHERHIAELTGLIRAAGGTPSEPGHRSSGVFKTALQQIGRLGGDTGILFAFEANDRQTRDKYWRHADNLHAPAVRTAVRHAAEDEDRHFAWATETLKRLNADPSSRSAHGSGVHLTTARSHRTEEPSHEVEVRFHHEHTEGETTVRESVLPLLSPRSRRSPVVSGSMPSSFR
jgi:rubrerythrin